MFKLNLKIALRNIWKYKTTSAIKLLGLVTGLSGVVMLIAYVMFELSYDKHHERAEQIYRLYTVDAESAEENIVLPSGLGTMLQQEIPEVENSTQLRQNTFQAKAGNEFFEAQVLTTEPAFFKMFTAPLSIGDGKTILNDPHSVLVTERFARLSFPGKDAVGQTIKLKGYTNDYLISGVIKDLPRASHFHTDIICKSDLDHKLNWRGYSGVPQYIQLRKGTNPALITEKLKMLYKKYEFPKNLTLKLMPVTQIHLYSHTKNEFEPNSDIKYIYIFTIVTFFILFVALANFINLTVATSFKRSKEIGIKKVMGASQAQLRWQFLSESYLYVIIAAFLSIVFSYDFIPLLGRQLGIEISLGEIVNAKTISIAFAVIIVSGFVAGFYPAMILSRLMPVRTLKGYTGHITGNFSFKRILMIFQFAISVFLIVCTLFIYKQLQYISNKNLGFDKDQVLVSSFNMPDEKLQSLKNDLLRQNEIISVSFSSFNPGASFGMSSTWTNDKDTTKYACDFISVDFDFIKTLNIQVLQGRAFDPKYGSDISNNQSPIMLNEAAVQLLALSNPIDTVLSYPGLQGRVVGVVKNFNGMSLHNKVTPLAITLSPKNTFGYMYIKVKGGDIRQTKETIDMAWKRYFPDVSSDFQFISSHLEKLYQAEFRLGSVFISFATMAIFLCCIGLFGVVYFDLEQRTKEIAVRKVMGATIKDLLTLLNGSFVKAVMLANVIVWPVAYFFVNEWLNSFYYRISITYTPFLLAFILCIFLTVLTVSLQAVKVVRKSPVKALKYE
ncbi:ABC transporter permease [Pedobacter nyackensis]|uniref:ABC transporter permease n=1 Tax=Pedobacter nyackensis TaxID=475255 RepID=UPI00292EB31F|nr:FtsX-like permease family protein [Pedobacter nyackensis]